MRTFWLNYNYYLDCTEMQGDCNSVIAEHGAVFDTDLLFLVDVLQPLSACPVHSVWNKADLKLQNSIDMLATVNPQVWLNVVLLAIEPFFALFALC